MSTQNSFMPTWPTLTLWFKIQVLVFFRYSDTHRSTGNHRWKDCLLYSQIPREGATPCHEGLVRKQREEGEYCGQDPLLWFLGETWVEQSKLV